MHPFSILTLGIFVAGYITARWDLVTRLYELAIFAWDHGVVVWVFFFFFAITVSSFPPPTTTTGASPVLIGVNANLLYDYDYADTNGERICTSFGFLFPLHSSD